MGHAYQAVQWNRQKYIYDAVLLLGVGVYLFGFLRLAPLLDPNAEESNVWIRAFGSAAFILLHLILSIGPLARLDSRFLPLLYNRRHMGVTMCLIALYHGELVLGWYHDFGNVEPLVSFYTSNLEWTSFRDFPFELLGEGALIIFVLMAATSHDFWLANLTAPMWKALHMGVYAAYVLVVAHVVLGALQSNQGLPMTASVCAGAMWIVGIHWYAAGKERRTDAEKSADSTGLVRVGPVSQIPENRAKIVCAAGERIAVFRYDGKVSAISNVCQHQNGPLGEGCVIDGLVTCPWHGFQYGPSTGASPPPFTEKVPTFRTVVTDGVAWVDPTPQTAGTHIEPSAVGGDS